MPSVPVDEDGRRRCRGGHHLAKRKRAAALTGPAHLLWFVWPRRETKDAVWGLQQDVLRREIDQFDGRKYCVVAVDRSTDAAAVDRSFWDEVCEIPNDPRQREVAGWRWLMQRVSGEPGLTVWLHAKGAFRGAAEPHLRRWWELGYETLLDVAAVRRALERRVMAGVFRRNEFARNLGVGWHFSGAFYAFRNDWVFARNWLPKGPIDPRGWYAEAWPALIAPRELTACLRFDGCGDLYQPTNWRELPCN
jgi:hypothetical protein